MGRVLPFPNLCPKSGGSNECRTAFSCAVPRTSHGGRNGVNQPNSRGERECPMNDRTAAQSLSTFKDGEDRLRRGSSRCMSESHARCRSARCPRPHILSPGEHSRARAKQLSLRLRREEESVVERVRRMRKPYPSSFLSEDRQSCSCHAPFAMASYVRLVCQLQRQGASSSLRSFEV